MAKLYFRYGAMNSGKTAILLQVAHNYEEQGKKVLVIKPKMDTKGEDKIVSRIGLKRKVDHLIEKKENIFDYAIEHTKGIDCILVDEAQFLERKQIDQLLEIVVQLDIPVICYGLRVDFQGNGFPGATRLLEIAQSIEEMKTICKCGRKASFNARIVNHEYSFSGEQVVIDGENSVIYEPLCHYCFLKEKKKWEEKQKTL